MTRTVRPVVVCQRQQVHLNVYKRRCRPAETEVCFGTVGTSEKIINMERRCI